MKIKGLQDFLNDDPSLTKKITYEECQNNKFIQENTDASLEDVYSAYCDIIGSDDNTK